MIDGAVCGLYSVLRVLLTYPVCTRVLQFMFMCSSYLAELVCQVKVSDQEAVEMARYLLDHEGLFVGSSAALNVAAVLHSIRRLS